ncbi:glycosyltransferase family 4 protein [Patescibacteria group bacterium]
MKKILYLITQSEWGGAQKYVFDLTMALKDKHIIEVAVGERKKNLNEDWLINLEKSNIKVWRLMHVVRELNLWHDFLSSWELYKLFLKSKPDIIHLNSSKIGSTGAVVGWLYKKIHQPNLKIVYTVHGFVFNEPLPYWRRKFYLWSEKFSGKFKDKLICVSEHDKIIGLNKHIADHDKFVTIHNGIDLKNLNFLDKQTARNKLSTTYNLQPTTYVIGTIANLYSTKGLEYLIKSAKILVEKNKNIKFIVIGEGGLRKDLEKEIKNFNLQDNFFLTGVLPDAHKYLSAFDIFVLSSIKEGFPYTLIEALVVGLPIVTTRVGGILEIVEPEVNGLMVEPQKPREIAKAIEKILDNPNLAEKLKQNNLIKAKKFSLEKMVEKTEEVYKN